MPVLVRPFTNPMTIATLIGAAFITTPAHATVKTRAIAAYSQPPQLIACTKQGCNPIPPGCRIVPERGLGGRRSSWDMVICPSR